MVKSISKTEKQTINLRKLLPITAVVPLIGILLSRRDIGGLMLLLIGITSGIFIGKNIEFTK